VEATLKQSGAESRDGGEVFDVVSERRDSESLAVITPISYVPSPCSSKN
jgi:hypothetical protein